MDKEAMQRVAQYTLCLSNERRVEIMGMLMKGDVCACELCARFQVSQPSISRHMAVMCESGLVTGQKNGRWIKYSLNRQAYKDMLKLLIDLES